MELDPEQVREAVRRLSLKKAAIFGADGHHYMLNPPLLVAEVIAFEQRHGIVLPYDYRHFITQIGNGGAGPYYGIFRLGEMDGLGNAIEPWHEDDGFVGVLSKPFPLQEAWNDLPAMPPRELMETSPDEYERQLEAFDNKYFESSLVNGAFPICHQGCAIRVWLVVTGIEAGHLWLDDRANHRGLSPMILKNGERATFSSWYYEWLVDPLVV